MAKNGVYYLHGDHPSLRSGQALGSVNTVKNYIEYLENSWLIFTLNVYDFSVKRQKIAPKKVWLMWGQR